MLVLAPIGPTLASLHGEIHFVQDIVLRAVEELDFLAQRIDYYSYSVSQNGERLYAPGISFTEPNLPFLIREIEQTLLQSQYGGLAC